MPRQFRSTIKHSNPEQGHVEVVKGNSSTDRSTTQQTWGYSNEDGRFKIKMLKDRATGWMNVLEFASNKIRLFRSMDSMGAKVYDAGNSTDHWNDVCADDFINKTHFYSGAPKQATGIVKAIKTKIVSDIDGSCDCKPDYATLPDWVRPRVKMQDKDGNTIYRAVRKDNKGKIVEALHEYERNDNGTPRVEDGISINRMQSILIKCIQDLIRRIEVLEEK